MIDGNLVIDKRRVVALYGLLWILFNTFLLYYVFLRAYFHDYKILIRVNHYNEAAIEFVILPVATITGLYAVYYFLCGGRK